MSKINWKIRIVNKQFWLSVVPAILLVIQAIGALFGYTLNFGELGDKLLAVINSIFSMLVILGIVIDPTTQGISDSKRAMQYQMPNKG